MSHPYPQDEYDPTCDCAACLKAKCTRLEAELAQAKERIGVLLRTNEKDEQENDALRAKLDAQGLLIVAARNWSEERSVSSLKDWRDDDLMKAIATYDGDYVGGSFCEGCDVSDCDEACAQSQTVAEVHALIDKHSADRTAGAQPRGPMTGEEIDAAYLAHQSGPYERTFTAGIKAAEAHHKIGANHG